MKKLLILLFTACTTLAQAQENEKERVMDVIENVFEAMRKSDSTMLKKSFVEKPNTFTAFFNQEGESVLRPGDFKRFKMP